MVAFDIEVSTTLSLLLARPSLTCQEETSGWNADDIALEIRADDDLIADIPNSVIGDFEDVGAARRRQMQPMTAYVEGIEVKIIEEDDIDDDDVGVGTVPVVDDVAGAPGFAVLHLGIDGRIMAASRSTSTTASTRSPASSPAGIPQPDTEVEE